MTEKAVGESNVVGQKEGDQRLEPMLEARIRIRAYELYEQRHGATGDPQDDWFRAEAEVKGEGRGNQAAK